MRTHARVAAVAAAVVTAAGSAVVAAPAQAYTQTQARVVGTGGIGVGCRDAPGGPVTCGYGSPEFKPSPPAPANYGVVNLVCFYRYGDPVGSNGNDLWWKVTYGGKTFFVADHWLDTPAPVNHTPTWYNGVGCL